MRALVKAEAAPGLTLMHVPDPVVGPTEVMIEVSHAAICGTDLHIHQWNQWAQETVQPPVTLGHEFVGRIVEVGSQVEHLETGTRVVGEGHVVCGQCRNCKAGDGHLCRNTIGIGIHRDGGFAQRVVIPAANVYPVPDGVPDEVAAILDPLGNAVHTALSFDLVGEDVLITGAGPIGQMAAAVCRHAGARHVVVTDVRPARLRRASAMGATRTVDAMSESLVDVMAELEMREGFDIGLEMSGSGAALSDLVEVMNHGAKVGLLGLFDEPVLVELNQLILKGLTVKGIYGREIFDTWYKATAMLESGLDVAPVISHRFTLDDFEAAFAVLESGEASKVVLEIN